MGVVSQLRHAGAVGVHEVDLPIPVAIRYERKAAPVGRPLGLRVRIGVMGQLRHARAIGVHDVDLPIPIAVRVEREATPVRRPSG